MKLDKMQFAKVIAFCVGNGMAGGEYEVTTLDTLIDVEVPVLPQGMVKVSDVDNLLALMQQGEKKIEAIKAYRIMTGEPLKEAKDAVERHWPVDGKKVSRNEARTVLKSFAMSDGECNLIERFIAALFE